MMNRRRWTEQRSEKKYKAST